MKRNHSGTLMDTNGKKSARASERGRDEEGHSQAGRLRHAGKSARSSGRGAEEDDLPRKGAKNTHMKLRARKAAGAEGKAKR